MPFPARTAAQRLLIAELSGAVELLIVGGSKEVYAEPAVAYLHAISADPLLLGDVLGTYLAHHEGNPEHYEGAVQLLRAAGADEQAAADMLEWQRERQRREQRTPTHFDVPGEQG